MPEDPKIAVAVLIVLNLLPAIGVLAWGWQSFELIFLYWIENLIIGLFTVLRMVVRPYGHAIDALYPLLLAPFFVMHYGAFCWGHGSFIISLFAPPALQSLDLATASLAVVQQNHWLLAVVSLGLLQVIDWLRSTRQYGLGTEGVKTLMVRPYRRIVVLHLTVLAGGSALSALDEPTVGLLLLVAIKTASDLWHWLLDDAGDTREAPFTPSPEQLDQMQAKYPKPAVTVNGVEREFDSFAAMAASSEYRMASALFKLVGARDEIKVMQAYMNMKIAEEKATL